MNAHAPSVQRGAVAFAGAAQLVGGSHAEPSALHASMEDAPAQRRLLGVQVHPLQRPPTHDDIAPHATVRYPPPSASQTLIDVEEAQVDAPGVQVHGRHCPLRQELPAAHARAV